MARIGMRSTEGMNCVLIRNASSSAQSAPEQCPRSIQASQKRCPSSTRTAPKQHASSTQAA
eukprot:112400-Lingulodinium_polyedra.AAC.1